MSENDIEQLKSRIIELEGEIHEHPDVAEYDEEREIYLKSLGFKIIFFQIQQR